MANQQVITAPRIFTGREWLSNQAILVEDQRIKAIVPAATVTATTHSYNDCFIAPAFIDLQIYGAGERLLAVYPEAASLQILADHCAGGGTALCLPTVATNSYEVFFQSIDAVKAYWQGGGKGIAGLHIEGPWINTQKRGAHVEALIHTPTIEQATLLLEYGKGVIKMITLAPEVCNSRLIQLIRSYGIIVSAGHSNATYEEAKNSFTDGITAVTHLYNAMSPLQHRAPGLAGAAMDNETVSASIIPDGQHVDFAAVRIAKQVMKERLFVITDAVTTTTEGYYKHQLNGEQYEADGILSGSALTMNKAVKNLVMYCKVEAGEALRMCSYYPARVMGWDQQYGLLQPGYAASLVILNNEYEVMDTFF